MPRTHVAIFCHVFPLQLAVRVRSGGRGALCILFVAVSATPTLVLGFIRSCLHLQNALNEKDLYAALQLAASQELTAQHGVQLRRAVRVAAFTLRLLACHECSIGFPSGEMRRNTRTNRLRRGKKLSWTLRPPAPLVCWLMTLWRKCARMRICLKRCWRVRAVGGCVL